jgi:DNA-binding phage protein
MRGRHTALTLRLEPEAVGVLLACQRATARQSAGLVRRARAVLLRHQGLSISAIARLIGVSRHSVYKALWRYQAGGFAGLQGQRPGPRTQGRIGR